MSKFTTAKELRDKFNSDLEELQNNCTHLDQSDYVDEYWAPAHSTGAKIKYCLDCEKTIERIVPEYELQITSNITDKGDHYTLNYEKITIY